MKTPRRLLGPFLLALTLTLMSCTAGPPRSAVQVTPPPSAPALPVTDEATAAAIDAALAGDHRLESNRARDRYRHPKETLTFFGLRREMTVLEIWPGPAGWYTEVLAPVLRERGRYIAAQWDPNLKVQYFQDGLRTFRSKLESRPDVYDRVEITALQTPEAMKPVAPDSVDMVLTFRNIHNWMSRDEARRYFEVMFTTLKPGGILGVVEHRAPDTRPQDPLARDGYVREDFAISLIESAGFRLLARSEINANPNDTKDYDQGVWTLPPSLRLGDRDRDRYLAIGESDRFTLRFQKPGR